VHTSHPEACASQTITWRHPTSIIAPTYFFIPWLFKEHATTLLIDVDVAHTLNKIFCRVDFLSLAVNVFLALVKLIR